MNPEIENELAIRDKLIAGLEKEISLQDKIIKEQKTRFIHLKNNSLNSRC